MSRPLWQLDACALGEQLRQKQLDPVELLTACEERIGWLNPQLNAIVNFSGSAAADARASAERFARGEPLSPIDGLPLVVKDNLVVQAMPATFGSRLYADYIPDSDEIPVERLRRAGAVIVGKTNVPEFCVEGFTDNELFGPTRNPWDPNLTPAGSSGGSVAAVAAAMVPLAIGTDGGGSIRRPAAFTNLVGLKPSIGRIPRGGGLPQLLLDMEVVGSLTRTVRDQAMMFDLLAGPDARDHRSRQFGAGAGSAALTQPFKPLKILAVERFGSAPLDPVIATSFAQMLDTLSNLGHQVERGPLPLDIETLNARWSSIAAIGLALLLDRDPRMRTLAGKKYLEWAEQQTTGASMLDIVETVGAIRDQASLAFEHTDIIMTPTCAAMPWPTGIDFPPHIDGQPAGPRGPAVYTGWVNACGHPAISVPGAMSPAGMPIGMQFVGDFGQDERLLQLAAQIEQAQPWAEQWPAIAS